MQTRLCKIAAFVIALFGMLHMHAGAPDWQRVNYTSSTTFVGFMSLSYTEVNEGDYVGAFVNDECRMIVKLFKHGDSLYVSGILHGGDILEQNEAETATFKLWRATSNSEVELTGSVETKPQETPGIYMYEIGASAKDVELTTLKVAGVTVPLQNGVTEYDVDLTSDDVPSMGDYVVGASDDKASIDIDPASSVPGKTKITVSADGQDDIVYTINLNFECDLNAPTISGDLEFCEGESSELTASGKSGASFTWKNESGKVVSNKASCTVEKGGTYTVTQNDGCESPAESVDVTENPLPTMKITAETPLYTTDDAIEITITPSDGDLSSNGDGLSGSTFDPEEAGVGTHTLTLKAESSKGCIGTKTATIVVMKPSELDVSELSDLIKEAKEKRDNATIGTEAGTYLQTSVDDLNTAIGEAEDALIDAEDETDIDNAVKDLQDAIDKFLPIEETELNYTGIDDALDKADELKGSINPSSYISGYEEITDAIAEAKVVKKTATTQDELDDAEEELLKIIQHVLDNMPTAIEDMEDVSVDPTITNGIVYITGADDIVSVTVTSSSGAKIKDISIESDNVCVDLSSYANSIYNFVLISSNGKIKTVKVIKK